MENANGEVGKGTPPELYKYYSPSGVERTIFDNTIKWEVPCEENDPFEALPSGWDLNTIKNAPGCRRGDKNFLDAIFRAKEVQRGISHVAAFVSFTKDKKDILMWAHYADKYKGACLRFDISRLLKNFKNGATLEQVKYAEVKAKERERVPVSPDDPTGMSPEYQRHAIYFLTKKANEWTYEDECRLITTPVEAEFINCIKIKDASGEKYILVSDIPQGSITELIFGYNMPVSTRLALAKQVRLKHPECKFAEVVPDRRRYELEIEPLELVAGIDSTNQASN